jgi:hypothetical protein
LKKFNVLKVLDVFFRGLKVSPQFCGFALSGSRSKKARLALQNGRNYMNLTKKASFGANALHKGNKINNLENL